MGNRRRILWLVPLMALIVIGVVVGIGLLILAPKPYRTAIVLGGTIVTPDEIIEPGWIVVDRRRIKSVSTEKPIVPGAIEIETDGLIFPGLINLHDHVVWNVIPRWDPDRLFLNRYEWRMGYEGFDSIRGVYGDLRSEHLCDMNTYGEVRALAGGTTSIVGTTNRLCIRGLVRNLDRYSGLYPLPMVRDHAHIRNYVDLPADARKIEGFLRDDASEAFLLHLAEGRGSAMRAEFDQLDDAGLLTEKTVIVHGVALNPDQFDRMGEAGASLIWSPRTNLELYGQTADVRSALDAGVTVALAPDWAITGSSSILDELDVAAWWNAVYLDHALSDRELVAMVTKTPAVIAGIAEKVGTIREGKLADLLVISGDTSQPHRALIEADSGDVELVLIDGRPVYGTATLMERFWSPSDIAEVEVLGTAKALLRPDLPVMVTELEQAMTDHGSHLAPIAEAGESWIPDTVVQQAAETPPETPGEQIDWDDAVFYFGEHKTVCGPVVDSAYAASSSRKPTYLNVGHPYPHIERFTVVIWGEDRDKFPGSPEDLYLGEDVCVSGVIESYRGAAQIIAEEPSQITTN